MEKTANTEPRFTEKEVPLPVVASGWFLNFPQSLRVVAAYAFETSPPEPAPAEADVPVVVEKT